MISKYVICCFHLQTYVKVPNERRYIDVELKVRLWIYLISHGMTSISSSKIKRSKFFRCLLKKESFTSMIIEYNQPTSHMYISGQIIIFHQPRFPWNKGISPTKPPFRVTSADVVIIWPDIWIIKAQHERSKSTAPGLNNESILYLNCVTPPIVSRAGTPVVSHKSHSCTPWKKNPRLSLATKKHYLGSCRCSKLSNKINTGQTLSVKASKLYPKEFPSRPPTRVENESLIQYVFFFQFHLFLYHFQNCKMQHPRWSKGSCLSCHPVVLPVPQGAKVLETAMDRSMLLALHLGMGPTIERTQTKVYPLKTNMTMENHHFC